MGKFLLGLVTGAILVVLIGVIGFFAVASLRAELSLYPECRD